MMRSLAILIGLGLLLVESAATVAFHGMNSSHLRTRCAKTATGTSYGKNTCRCVGIDNLKGYYATQESFHHVQRSAETGASCEAWDKGMHPKCRGSVVPKWCSQEWCYVDPCSCDLEVLPKQTLVGITYQGSPAYWSYNTCGGMDFYSSEENPDACILQASEGDCSEKPKCAWDAKRKECGGKEVLKTCKEAVKKDESVYGQEDCRCIGLGDKDVGKTFMHINDTHLNAYPASVGATCRAWESDTHPDCLKGGAKPSWCSAKWCFVDPCKCKTKSPPMAVMPANRYMRFQGKTAYWTYETCGSTDTWSSDHKGQYCVSKKTEAECLKLDKCAWSGDQCMGKALVDICAKQEATGVLGMEDPLQSGALCLEPLTTLLVMLGAFGIVLMQ